MNTLNFRIPGPTPLPPEVIKAVGQQMINHRSKGYEEIQARVTKNLKHFFQTEHDVYLMTSSGTGGFDTSIANFYSPGDTVLSFTCGTFGERWAETARAYGLNVIQTKFEPGKAVTAEKVQEVLNENDDIKGVMFTHNETSIGVLNPISLFAPLVKAHPAKPLLMVDSISGLGAVHLPMDTIGIDVLITSSQKAWMSPPGFCMIGVSPAAWERYETAKLPRYYFDLKLAKEFAEKNQTPATPAVAVLFGLDAALDMMMKEGRENVFARHIEMRDMFRAGVKKIGVELLVADEVASPTVTSINVPDGVDAHDWSTKLKSEYNTVVAGGMGSLKGKIIRVAHMGYCRKKDMEITLDALKKSL